MCITDRFLAAIPHAGMPYPDVVGRGTQSCLNLMFDALLTPIGDLPLSELGEAGGRGIRQAMGVENSGGRGNNG